MIDLKEIFETQHMIDREHLDIRTITMGISLRDCADGDAKRATQKIYEKITRSAEKLVSVGENIEREMGIPIVHKRISVTPMALVAEAAHAMHPIAGQGLNLSLRDVAALGELITQAKDSGDDIGSDSLLALYQQQILL